MSSFLHAVKVMAVFGKGHHFNVLEFEMIFMDVFHVFQLKANHNLSPYYFDLFMYFLFHTMLYVFYVATHTVCVSSVDILFF